MIDRGYVRVCCSIGDVLIAEELPKCDRRVEGVTGKACKEAEALDIFVEGAKPRDATGGLGGTSEVGRLE
jgi:hypothetical protein